jgi:hypothetical protein
MHHVGQDRDRCFGPDGESNLTHPGGRVRPHRDGADQGVPVGVQFEAARLSRSVVVSPRSPLTVTSPGPGASPTARTEGMAKTQRGMAP